MTKEKAIQEWLNWCNEVVCPKFVDEFKRKQFNPSVFELNLNGWREIKMIRISEADAGFMMAVFEVSLDCKAIPVRNYVLNSDEFNLMKNALCLDATEV